MSKVLLSVGAVMLLVCSIAAAGEPGKLHGELEFSYLTSYIWRGFDIYGPGSHSGIAPAVTVDLFGSGFGFRAQQNRAISGGYENGERWDYMPFYRGMLWGDEKYAMQYHLGYVYYNYPDLSWQLADLMELHGVFSFPNLLPVKGLVPSYCLVKLWNANSGALVASKVDLTRGVPSRGKASGFAHIFMLDYGIPIKSILGNQPEQVIKLHTEIVYNGGVGPAGKMVDHDWSNQVFGLATDFDLGNNVIFSPAVYYQSSWDDSVNTEDEYWGVLTMKYRF